MRGEKGRHTFPVRHPSCSSCSAIIPRRDACRTVSAACTALARIPNTRSQRHHQTLCLHAGTPSCTATAAPATIAHATSKPRSRRDPPWNRRRWARCSSSRSPCRSHQRSNRARVDKWRRRRRSTGPLPQAPPGRRSAPPPDRPAAAAAAVAAVTRRWHAATWICPLA